MDKPVLVSRIINHSSRRHQTPVNVTKAAQMRATADMAKGVSPAYAATRAMRFLATWAETPSLGAISRGLRHIVNTENPSGKRLQPFVGSGGSSTG
jgi:hypothetical protein